MRMNHKRTSGSADAIRRRGKGYLGAHVGHDLVAAYAREAKKRNIPMSRLIAKILRCVISGKLVDAVLDGD